MQYYKIFWVFMIVILGKSSLANVVVKGFVKDSAGVVLSEANITVLRSTLGAASDDEGFYFIENVKPGSCDISCSYIGYYTNLKRGVKIPKEGSVILNFNMIPNAYSFKDVNVVIKGKKEKKQEDLYLKYRNDIVVMDKSIDESIPTPIFISNTDQEIADWLDYIYWYSWRYTIGFFY